MKEILNIETERADDIPLLLAHMQRMNLADLLDKHIPTHGNRKGLSLGNVMMVLVISYSFRSESSNESCPRMGNAAKRSSAWLWAKNV